MSSPCTVCTGIFHGRKSVNHNDIHGRGSRTTRDGFALGDSDSDSNIEGEDSDRKRVRHYYRHYPNFLEFERSAGQGCYLCRVLLAQMPAEDIDSLREYARLVADSSSYRAQMWYSIWPSGGSPAHASDDPPFNLRVTARLVRPDISRLVQRPWPVTCKTSTLSMSLMLKPVHGETDGSPTRPNFSLLPAFTGSKSCFKFMEQWINNCDASHNRCRSIRNVNWLPTRLVDVGDDDEGIRLCLSKDLPLGTQFISLSHCWGKNQILRCLRGNINQLMELIPFASLSNTFKDAVNVTRRLGSVFGIRHVWIDSLCIIQDSTEDWLYEASQMGNVYTNAWCNIAATASKDGSEGCFRQRDPLLSQPVRVIATWDGITPGAYYAFDVDSMNRNVSKAPLNTRGWVVQERLLSPRIVHFASDQLYWECLEMDASEAFPNGMPKQVVGRFKDLNPQSAGREARAERGLESEPVVNTMAIWSKIVGQYTRCNLTMARDKMVALSALARNVQAQLGPEVRYVAGMWDKYVATQLFWQVSGNASRPAEYRAPSWSWMSVDGQISIENVHQLNQREVMLEIVEICVETGGPDEFVGPITRGLLTVRGMLARAALTYDEQTEEASLVMNGNEVDWLFWWDVEFGTGRERELYCLPLRKSHYGNSYDGLFLVQVPSSKGTYQRWGYFSAFQLGGREFERAGKLNESEYQEFDGVNKYTISIV